MTFYLSMHFEYYFYVYSGKSESGCVVRARAFCSMRKNDAPYMVHVTVTQVQGKALGQVPKFVPAVFFLLSHFFLLFVSKKKQSN